MKTAKSIILLLVCTCLALGLIIHHGQSLAAPEPGDATVSTEPTVESAAPGNQTPEPVRQYAAAKKAVLSASELTLSYTYTQSRTVGEETYLEQRTGTAGYTGKNSEALEALISEDVTYGSYNVHCTESYIDSKAYTQIRGTSFACEMTADAFQARQLPAALINEALYQEMTYSEDGLEFQFSKPSYLESWLNTSGEAVLIAANGTVTLDNNGNMVQTAYHAEYSLGTATYTVDVAVAITASADLTDAQPEYPESCSLVADLEIPRHLLRTVGNVYTARAMTTEYSDALYFGLLQQTRTENRVVCTYGSDENFAASLSSQITQSNSTGSSSVLTQVSTFLNGQYSSSVNGSDAVTDPNATAENVRILCEDTILSSLIPLEYIGSAQITDTGDFLYIHFTGNDAYIQYFSGMIYAMYQYQTSLDTLADSCSTEAAESYLIINKYTGLPTAMGMDLRRTHVFDGVTYSMAYQLDQALTLSCPNAYENITGESNTEPANESITPLFYQITGGDGRQLWLLGTMDVGDSRATALPTQILDALTGADALAVEYDADAFAAAVAADPALQSQLAEAYYNTNSTTADLVSKELYERMYPLMLATGGCNASSNYLKPVIWESKIEDLFLTQSYGLTAASGCDRALLRMASEQALPVYQIESGLSRLHLLTGFSKQLQSLMLERLLDQGMVNYYDRLLQEYELWCLGDAAGLEALLAIRTEGMTEAQLALYEEYYKAMYTDRTNLMYQTVEGYLNSGETVFCAVDFANLLGDDGLIAALTDAGYTVEQVSFE